MIPLHPPFGLRGTGCNNLDPQPFTHPSKLRYRRLSLQYLLAGGFAHVHIFPIRVQRPRYSILLDPSRQHAHRRPDGFLLSQPAQRRSGSIIHQVHQTAARPAFFQPLVEAAVHLQQFAEMFAAGSPAPMRPHFPFPAPQPGCQHPRRRVPAPISIPFSLARCSAASVGPNLSPGSPEYCARISPSTLARNFCGLARFDLRPALPCTSPAAPCFRYRFQSRLVCRQLSSIRSAASPSVHSLAATCASTAARRTSRSLIAVLPNPTSFRGLQSRGHF